MSLHEAPAALHTENEGFSVNHCFCSQFQTQNLTIWRGILKKLKIFFSIMNSSKKTSLIIYTGVMVWEIQVELYNSFFRFENTRIFLF
jgi:hypothetical protein